MFHGKQGRIHGNPVADGWAGAVMRKPLGIKKYYGPTDGPTYRPTDTAWCRVACPRLKTSLWITKLEKTILDIYLNSLEAKEALLFKPLVTDLFSKQVQILHLVTVEPACWKTRSWRPNKRKYIKSKQTGQRIKRRSWKPNWHWQTLKQTQWALIGYGFKKIPASSGLYQ